MRDRAAGNSPSDAQRRIAERKVREQAHRETVERFGVFTPENAAEAIAWQDARIRELIRTLPPR
jgi:hypothetical protein